MGLTTGRLDIGKSKRSESGAEEVGQRGVVVERGASWSSATARGHEDSHGPGMRDGRALNVTPGSQALVTGSAPVTRARRDPSVPRQS
eukprot:752915-Hanusia_phi.AAC.1